MHQLWDNLVEEVLPLLSDLELRECAVELDSPLEQLLVLVSEVVEDGVLLQALTEVAQVLRCGPTGMTLDLQDFQMVH